jgi:hypothetical protein
MKHENQELTPTVAEACHRSWDHSGRDRIIFKFFLDLSPLRDIIRDLCFEPKNVKPGGARACEMISNRITFLLTVEDATFFAAAPASGDVLDIKILDAE